jgi:hypothetical protein
MVHSAMLSNPGRRDVRRIGLVIGCSRQAEEVMSERKKAFMLNVRGFRAFVQTRTVLFSCILMLFQNVYLQRAESKKSIETLK